MLFGQRKPNEHYFYGAVIKGKPYLFIKDAHYIKRIQSLLIKSQISAQGTLDLVDSPLQIDAATPRTFPDIALSADYEKMFTYYPFKGDISSLRYIIPLPNDKIAIQILSNNSTGARAVITVDSLYYHPEGQVLIKCSELQAEEKLTFNADSPTIVSVIGTRFRRESVRDTSLDTNIPEQVQDKLQKLVLELTDTKKSNLTQRSVETAVQPFRFTDRYNSNHAQILYALILYTCCYERSSKGYIVVCDADGKEVWRSKEGFYYGGVQVTDVDQDMNSELIFRPLNGDFYIKLLLPDSDYNTGRFRPRNIFDYLSPFNRDSGC